MSYLVESGNQPRDDVKARGAVEADGLVRPCRFRFAFCVKPSPGTGQRETRAMRVARIIEELEKSDATGREAQDAARLGFLAWVVAQPGLVTDQAIRDARAELDLCRVSSAAARAFAEVLPQARPGVHHVAQGSGRRGGRQTGRMT